MITAGGRRAADRPGAPLPAPLVDRRGRAGDRARRGLRLGRRRSSWRRSSTSSSRCRTSSQARADVLELGREAGVDIGQVYRVDASRRVDRAQRLRRRHRLHQARRALRQPARARRAARAAARSWPTSSATSPTTTSRAGSSTSRSSPRSGCSSPRAGARDRPPHRDRPGDPGGDPRLLPRASTLAVARAQRPRQPALAQVEASADQFALELTHDPEGADRRPGAARARRTSPTPTRPAVYSFLFGTHPTTVERIGAALAYEQEQAEAN